MYTSALVALAASLATTHAAFQGFNYGSTFTDGSFKSQSDFQAEFTTAKNLAGTHGGFTSARLYTMIAGGTTNTPTGAIAAAMATNTSLLLGLWASGGQTGIDNELAALKSALASGGSNFASLIAAISVGSEDLYRISPTGIINKSGIGADPATIVDYIKQTRAAISGTAASGVPVGHVDTWTAWVNGSNAAVVDACDFLGMDAYPYFQTTEANSITQGKSDFFAALSATQGASNGKPVWITETGWPVSGPTANLAIPSLANAKTYWDEVACQVLGTTNTWWFTLQDGAPTTPSPSFGLVGSTLTTTPLYDLTCPKVQPSSSASSSGQASSSPISILPPPPASSYSPPPASSSASSSPSDSGSSPTTSTTTTISSSAPLYSTPSPSSYSPSPSQPTASGSTMSSVKTVAPYPSGSGSSGSATTPASGSGSGSSPSAAATTSTGAAAPVATAAGVVMGAVALAVGFAL